MRLLRGVALWQVFLKQLDPDVLARITLRARMAD